DRAAGLSYYFVFALLPTLLFLTALVGLLPLPDLMSRLLDYADRMLPGDAASLLRKTLAEVVSGASGGLLSIGVFVALWVASSGMLSIVTALNVAYRVGVSRPWWKSRLVALGLTIGFSLFTLTALLLLVFGGRIGEAVARWVGLGPLFTLAWTLLVGAEIDSVVDEADGRDAAPPPTPPASGGKIVTTSPPVSGRPGGAS